MDRRDYTPTKSSMYMSTLYQQRPSQSKHTPEVAPRSNLDVSLLKEYQALKQQVRQLQYENRKMSNEAEKLRYEKNIHENKYLQKISYQEETIAKFQKEKNYQLDLMKIKNQEAIKKLRREYELKIDQVQRFIKEKDYQNRELNQKNAYFEMKINELRHGVQIMEGELLKFRQHNTKLNDFLGEEERAREKLEILTEELEKQKREMEGEIHVLLEIQAEKSRDTNALEVKLKNSEANQRALCEKINVLTDNFSKLEEHISVMKENLLSADIRNQEIQQQLQRTEFQLSDKQNVVLQQNELEAQLRRALQIEQKKESRRERELDELVQENQRLVSELSLNRQKLHEICITQGIDV